MTPWQICLQNLDPPRLPPSELWVQVAAHKARRPPSIRPTMQTIREQNERILAMLADGEMTSGTIVACMDDLHESMVMRRIDRLREEGRIVKRVVISKQVPFRTIWWRLAA